VARSNQAQQASRGEKLRRVRDLALAIHEYGKPVAATRLLVCARRRGSQRSLVWPLSSWYWRWIYSATGFATRSIRGCACDIGSTSFCLGTNPLLMPLPRATTASNTAAIHIRTHRR
jgi:hypothetical protein